MRNKKLKKLFKFVSTILILSLIISVMPTVGSAAETNNDPVIVVSLGDSYSSGEGIEEFYGQELGLTTKVDNEDWLAHRSKKSWPSLLKIPNQDGTYSQTMGNYRADYGAVSDEYEWYFGAVSGAETIHFSSEQPKEVKKGFWVPPIIFKDQSLSPQLDIFDTITGDVDYVTMSIGGNDVHFSEIVTTCVVHSSTVTFGRQAKLEKDLNTLWDNIDNTMSDIEGVYRAVALEAPNADIIVAGYPKLFDPNGGGTITSNEAALVNEKVTAFNDKIEALIESLDEELKIHFVDVEPSFNTHGAYSADNWINPVWLVPKGEDINEFTIGSSYSVHPNEHGAQAYARCVNTKIAEIEFSKQTGTLSGKICKASDRTTPVTSAEINAYSPLCSEDATPDNNGNYSMELPANRYYVTVKADGYIPFKAYAVVKENQTEYMQTFLMVEGEETDIGSAQGMITNALNGVGLGDVTLDVRAGWNNEDEGEILTTVTTDDYGAYLVTLPIGNYTLCASKDGFAPTMINIIVQKTNSGNQDGTMTPVLSGDNYRIVLRWGENPRDLDSHVVGSLSNGNSFHVYYSHKSQYDGEIEVCNLDYDDTTSFGPETITLNATTNRPYYYYIYRFAGSGTVASSGAYIKVYQGENEIATFNVPTNLGSGDYWNVFAIVDGELVVRNTMTSSAETSYANSNISTFSLRAPRVEEHPVYDDSYPAKEETNIDAADPTEDTSVTTEPETPDESTDSAVEPTNEEESIIVTENAETTEEPPVTSDEDIANDNEASALQVETRKIYLSLGQFDQDYIWKVAAQDTEYDLTEEAEDIYAVELPVDTETIIIHGENEELQIASVEISMDDIQENNCIVALACEDDVDEFEILWGIYDPETEEITFEIEGNLVNVEEDAEETTPAEPTEALESSIIEETESTEETESKETTVGEKVEDPEETDAVS